MINALAIDTEEWFHSELLKGKRLPIYQVAESTIQVINLLDKYQIKASFFIVGEIAERHPELIKLIFSKGHEIGCHGYTHTPLWKLNEKLFMKELEDFNNIIKKILGEIKIKGFRAPCFSLDNRTKWSLKLLSDFGYQYDASIFPVKLNTVYGINGAPIRPYQISFDDVRREDKNSPLIEFPTALLKLGRIKIPITGGFYLRLFPIPLLIWGLRKINRDQPFLFYFHPWEGYKKTPRLNLNFINKFISYYGINFALKKFEYILNNFKFGRIDQILGL